ncbi:MAG: hypothetical protein ACTSP3_04705 [Candidatus Heimdallarchaeaceae archaeon]
MKKENIDQSQLPRLKEILKENFKKMVSDFNNYVKTSSELKVDYSNIGLQIIGKNSTSFPRLYTIHFEFIKEFMLKLFHDKKYEVFFIELKKYKLFDIETNLLNPHLTYFGSMLMGYLGKITETEFFETDKIKKQLPFRFDEDLFEKYWDAYLPWISNLPVKVKIYYLIYGVKLEGDDYTFDKYRNLKLRIPSIKEKEKLVDEMDIRIFYFEGEFKAINRAKIIAECSAWVEGEVEFNTEQLEETFTVLDILHPSYIEEAFHLLGATDVYVDFFTLNNKFYPQKITIEPPLDQSKGIALASPIFQYPEWMQLSFFPPKITLILNQENRDFLSFYPVFRKNLPKDSIVKLSIFRLKRALKSRLIMDIILEVVIGIESLLVEGTGDLSLQFRINTSWLIGRNYEERKLIEDFCKNLYTLRSKIVHEGGKTKDIEKITSKFGGNHQTAELARKIYRLILLRMVVIEGKKIKFINRNDLIKIIKQARLGGNLDIKEHELFTRTYNDFIDELMKKIQA